MNKAEFMNTLKELIPDYEANEILNDFEEHFATGVDQGKTEEEIVTDLGNPIDIAREYGYEKKEEEKKPRASVENRIISSIGLLLFDAIIGIAIVSSLFAVWISLWAVVLSVLVAAVACIIAAFGTVFFVSFPWYICLTVGISLLGLTGLFGVGMVYVSKYFGLGLLWYAKLHKKVFMGE